MAGTTAATQHQRPLEGASAAPMERRAVPIKWWAGLGAAILVFQAYVLISWVTGPYFEPVESGPSEPPGWMQAALVFWQLVLPLATLWVAYRFVLRPWRRERRLGTDALLVIAFATLWFQDPLSAYGGQWYSYNAWQLNMGSWVNDVPGWLSYGEPGAQVAVPLLVLPFAYICIFLVGALLGCAVMRRARARWPSLGAPALVAICFPAMVAFDVVFEGLVFMPLGAWEYPGGHLAIFPSTYHKYPLNEALTTGALFTAFASLRFFTDDRGRTIVERGIERVRGSSGRRTALRALAVIAAAHVIIFLTYNLPNFWVGTHSTEWPRDLQQRSYFSYTCGEGVGRACPGPDVPLIRNGNDGVGGGSAYLDDAGGLVIPEGTELPRPVPFEVEGR